MVHIPIESTLLVRTCHVAPDITEGDALLATDVIDDVIVQAAQRAKLSKVLIALAPGQIPPEGDYETVTCYVRLIPKAQLASAVTQNQLLQRHGDGHRSRTAVDRIPRVHCR